MNRRARPGMAATRKHMALHVPPSTEELCWTIAADIRAVENALQAALNDPPSGRLDADEEARRRRYIEGMKFALGRALGAPLGDCQGHANAYLADFREERLNASRQPEA